MVDKFLNFLLGVALGKNLEFGFFLAKNGITARFGFLGRYGIERKNAVAERASVSMPKNINTVSIVNLFGFDNPNVVLVGANNGVSEHGEFFGDFNL
jgi:hypothetical protein